MVCRTKKSIIYHIPKCGGTWVHRTVRKSMGMKDQWRPRENGAYQELGLHYEHAVPNQVIDEDKEGLFSFCFVRHPVTWYRSFWCYRLKKHTLHLSFKLDLYWDINYEKFILTALDKYPNGFVSQLYKYYDLDNMDFVGRQENLANDLAKALRLAGDEFDKGILKNERRVNLSASNPKYGDQAIIGRMLEKRIEKVEHWVMDRYYTS